MIIETHAHLNFPEFDTDRAETIVRAHAAGVSTIILMATRIETSRSNLGLAEAHPSLWATVGIHPLEVEDAPEDALAQLREMAQHPRVVAIGEIGLDYHAFGPGEDHQDLKILQQRLFLQQLELAAELNLNVVLHTRECFQEELWEDVLQILRPFTGKLRAVFHCFKCTPAKVQQIVALGHLVSFTGMVTYPELPQIAQTAAQIPSDHFMLETDCPFMHPMPDQEGRSEPAHLREIAEYIARLRQVSFEHLAQQTSATAREFFRLQHE